MAHYVKNKDLYANLKEYFELKDSKDELKTKSKKPTAKAVRRQKELYDTLFISFTLIAKNYLNRNNLSGYSHDWKEDMISQATIVCIEKMHKFDFQYDNPFAYFTTVCTNYFKSFLKDNKRHAHTHIAVDFYSAMGGTIRE